MNLQRDERIVCGARCSWWDSVYEARRSDAQGGIGVPSCPHCGSVLLEYPDEATWFARADEFERAGHPGYRELIEWARGKCFPRWADAKAAFEQAKGVH